MRSVQKSAVQLSPIDFSDLKIDSTFLSAMSNLQSKRFKYIYCCPLTRAPLGYSAIRALLGGGADSAPLSNFRTDGRRKTGKTAIESSQQGGS